MGLLPIEFFLKMKLHSDLPVYKSCYDLLLEIFLFTKEFSKEYKYTVGESLKKPRSFPVIYPTFNEKCFSAISATCSPIAKEAVAAGDGAFNT